MKTKLPHFYNITKMIYTFSPFVNQNTTHYGFGFNYSIIKWCTLMKLIDNISITYN